MLDPSSSDNTDLMINNSGNVAARNFRCVMLSV